MIDRVLELNRSLRAAGVPVAVSDGIDALRAIEHIPIGDRAAVKAALQTTMIKSPAHVDAFDTLFDLYFGTGRAAPDAEDEVAPLELASFIDEVAAAMAGDGSGFEGLARRAVAHFGRIDTTPASFSQYQVVRALGLDSLLARLLRQLEDGPGSSLERRLRRDELEGLMRAFRNALLAETRRRMAEQRGPEAVAAYAVEPLPEEVNFITMSADMTALRRAIRPLARKLATRIAMKRKRAHRGQLDIRRTVRHSLSTGGVPFDPHFRRRAPHRPELFVLCDVSSSVARFARFALMLTHALSAQFSKVRSFAFIDTIDEVTRFFQHEDFWAAVERMNHEAKVTWSDAHSDYGTSLERFWHEFGSEIGPKTTLLILGDARNNYRSRKEWALEALTEKARHTYWLNPEPKTDWDTGDSVASSYATIVDKMVEVRNLKQLEDFIERRL
jgi:uncharacterized protein with von Willebrand factor type A (vWA) domain